MRVVLSVGTHEQSFDRMVRVADELASAGDQVTIQYGYSTPPVAAQGFDFAASEELSALLQSADVVITHAGPATVLQALEAGKLPIVFPRAQGYGEHVDDHQVSFARHLQRQGLAHVGTTESEVLALVSEGPKPADAVFERRERVASNRRRVADSLDEWLTVRHPGTRG